MFKAIGAFLQPYMTWIIGGAIALAIGAFGVLYVDNVTTHSRLESVQNELKAANMLVEGQRRAIAAMDEVREYRNETNNMLRQLSRRMRETEGANEQVPPAVASVWADGIDCLRAHNCDTARPENVPSP
jgi:uncharacterized protein HemX